MGQIRPGLQIMSIITQMNAGENNFPVVLQGEVLCAFENIRCGQAAAFTAGKWHDAVAAKRVAAVLNLEKSAGSSRKS